MAEDCPLCFHETMDKLWFQQNILYLKPPGDSLPSSMEKMKEQEIAKATAENQNLESICQEKRKTRSNIVIGQPLFQLQPPPRQNIHSHSSSSDMSTSSQVKSRRRTPKKNMRSHRSLSELENYELKGFMNLGFTFPREKLSPQLMTTVPALQRLAEEGEGRRQSNEECVKRPYLSEAWQISSHGSPQFNLQMLSRSPQVADMKKHLRFWARKVASLVHHES
ncbi:hypothetical protein MUK42_16805 [Musa troglodytarum]|uniref:Uncharacterized protein n=1 Tax=Musa troglodytarum TaxID=320322 RepID=A0A9E7KIK4_9LILI|nr:hypothetical protein MUK42_16805 [Musa troglodytarum]